MMGTDAPGIANARKATKDVDRKGDLRGCHGDSAIARQELKHASAHLHSWPEAWLSAPCFPSLSIPLRPTDNSTS